MSANSSFDSFSFTLQNLELDKENQNEPTADPLASGDDSSYTYLHLYEQLIAAELGVSIKGQGIKLDSAEDGRDLLQKIENCKNLRYLELEGNSLGTPVAKSIGKLLESHPEFEVALWKDLFTTRLKDEIPKALAYLFGGIDLSGAVLQRLDLSDNAIGPVGMAGLVPFFSTKSSFGLKELIVSNQGLGPEGGTTFATALIKCYETSLNQGGQPFQLKVFVCGRNRLENKAATKFAEFFSMIGSLEEIQMPQNGINPPGVSALAAAFKKNPNLRILNLNDNTVRPDGAQDLSEAISTLNHLQELNFGDCLLKNEGVLSILNALPERLDSLVSVNFESNEITKEDGIQIAKKLASFQNLQCANFGSNEFGVHMMETMNDIAYKQSNGILMIGFEDDTGSGNEEEDEDQREGDDYDENFKPEGEEGEDDEDYEDYDENEGEEDPEKYNYQFESPEVTGSEDMLNKFLGETSICSPSKTNTTPVKNVFASPQFSGSNSPSTTSLFVGTPNLVDNNLASGNTPLFGGAPFGSTSFTSGSNSMFGGTPQGSNSLNNSSAPMFGGPPKIADANLANVSTSMFGMPQLGSNNMTNSSSTPSFGGAAQLGNDSLTSGGTSVFGGGSQVGNNNLFTFASNAAKSNFSFAPPTFGIGTAPVFGSPSNANSLVEDFLKTPSFPNYMKLTPAAEKKILLCFEEKFKDDKNEMMEQCISMALKVSSMVNTGGNQECFNELMGTALKSARNSNTFVTTVFVHLGLIHGEKRANIPKGEKPAAADTTKVDIVPEATTAALVGFLNQNTSPILVLQCMKEFFTSSTPAAKPNVKMPGRQLMLDTVNRHLAPYYAAINAK